MSYFLPDGRKVDAAGAIRALDAAAVTQAVLAKLRPGDPPKPTRPTRSSASSPKAATTRRGGASLFPTGDYPAITASGADPSLARQLPWQARRAFARAKTPQDAFELYERYAGPQGEALAALDSCQGGPLSIDVADYELEQQQAAQADVAASRDCAFDSWGRVIPQPSGVAASSADGEAYPAEWLTPEERQAAQQEARKPAPEVQASERRSGNDWHRNAEEWRRRLASNASLPARHLVNGSPERRDP